MPERREPLYAAVLVALSLVARAVFGLRVRGVEAVPRRGPVLLVANHVSFLDPPLLAAAVYRARRKVRFIALSTLFDVAFLGWVLRTGRMIPVARGAGVERMAADTCATLDKGEAVIVYPEGTIPTPGTPASAKPGAGLAALRTNAPVIPVASWGVERGRVRRALLRRSAAVVFGKPLDLSRWRGRTDRAAQAEVAREMLAAIRGLVTEAERLATRRE